MWSDYLEHYDIANVGNTGLHRSYLRCERQSAPQVHIPKFRGYDTRISWSARTPAGPTSCPASTAATKTKNRNWNQWEQEPPTSGGDMSVDHSWLEEEECKRERERKKCKTMEPDTTKRFWHETFCISSIPECFLSKKDFMNISKKDSKEKY